MDDRCKLVVAWPFKQPPITLARLQLLPGATIKLIARTSTDLWGDFEVLLTVALDVPRHCYSLGLYDGGDLRASEVFAGALVDVHSFLGRDDPALFIETILEAAISPRAQLSVCRQEDGDVEIVLEYSGRRFTGVVPARDVPWFFSGTTA